MIWKGLTTQIFKSISESSADHQYIKENKFDHDGVYGVNVQSNTQRKFFDIFNLNFIYTDQSNDQSQTQRFNER